MMKIILIIQLELKILMQQKALKRQKDMFSDVTILLDLICHPNTKTFYVRIKDGLKKKGVEFHLCEISIEDSQITEQDWLKQ